MTCGMQEPVISRTVITSKKNARHLTFTAQFDHCVTLARMTLVDDNCV